MNLCTSVIEEGGDGDSVDSEELSLLPYTLRYERCSIVLLLNDKEKVK